MCIGHTRYATTGSNDAGNLQPMVLRQPVTVGMAHNGNLVNYHRTCERLVERSRFAQQYK